MKKPSDAAITAAGGIEAGAIIAVMAGVVFYDDLVLTELLLAVAFTLSVWRYLKGGE